MKKIRKPENLLSKSSQIRKKVTVKLEEIREINEIRNELAKAHASSLKRLLKLISPYLARMNKRNREEAQMSPETGK